MKDFSEAQALAQQYAQHQLNATVTPTVLTVADAWVAGYRQAMRDLGDQLGLPPAGGWRSR